jgi:hypothetical protein
MPVTLVVGVFTCLFKDGKEESERIWQGFEGA